MNHIEKISRSLEEYNLDAMLITSEPGERYALGFQGEGWLLVGRQGAHYSTDGRYIEAAQKQVKGVQLSLISAQKGHLSLARDYIRAQRFERVGFESGYMNVEQYQRLCDALPCQLVPAQKLLTQLRASKDEEELSAMRRAQEITDQAFREILNFIRPGMSEQQVAARLVYEMLRRGARKVSFDPIVAAGANGSMPHAVPGETVIQAGMFVTMDFGCIWDGYCSDMTRTVAVGQPTEEMEKVYHTVLQAQKAGIAAARAGVTGSEIDAAREQWSDGSNTLAIAPGEVVVYSRNYVTNRSLEEAGVRIHTIPSAELSRGRGGPRCMSMPLWRDDP